MEEYKKAVIAIGNFDGVHVGHQAILAIASRLANERGVPCGVVTFHPHPVQVLFPQQPFPLILTQSQKLQLIKEQGVDACFVEHFDAAFAALSPRQFVEEILHRKLNASAIVVGHDFTFGAKGAGTTQLLQELAGQWGMETIVVSPVRYGDEVISSSAIRKAVLIGEMPKAAAFLGRPFSLTGIVVKGEGRGQHIGIPTANLAPEQTLLPGVGVYHTQVVVGDKIFNGATNVGYRPTFHQASQLQIETHIVGYRGDLYGKHIEVRFLRKLRDEKRFQSLEELVSQIRADIEQVTA